MKTFINIMICLALLCFNGCFNMYNEADEDLYSKVIPLVGLVGFYPFSGNANDVSGHNNNGIVNGTATLTADKDGNPNSAYNTIGSGWIQIPDDNSLDLQDFTLSAWIKMDQLNSAFNCIIGKDYSTAYAIGISSGGSGVCPAPGGVLRPMRVYVNNVVYYFNNSDFACSTWYHVAVTYNNITRAVQLYVNGTILENATLPIGSMSSNTYSLGIGQDGRNFDRFDGVIDEVCIYNRVLTAYEVQLLYSH